MAVRIVVAVTDGDWFNQLRRHLDLAEVNFWSPSPKSFRALQPGELFLFKLHAPINMIVGGGVFASSTIMPLSLAWEAFGIANGVTSLIEMRTRILRYRKVDPATAGSIEIGCRILTQPFFFPESQWFSPPASWSPNIVSLRGYDTSEPEGKALWEAAQAAIAPSVGPHSLAEEQARYGEPTLIRPRLGQGAFRLVVTDLYARRCAITKERTLPALEAAHIRPYADGGEHSPSNGILMRRDIHSLFDQGYVTVTPEHRFEPPRPSYPQSTTSTSPAKPQTGSRKAYYNRRRLKAVVDVAGCQWPDDYDKFNSLTSARRSDLASKLDCIIIHRGEMVVQLDVIGDLKQVVWEKNGQTLQLWTGSYYFKNERDWALDAECKPDDHRCRAKVASRFELEY